MCVCVYMIEHVCVLWAMLHNHSCRLYDLFKSLTCICFVHLYTCICFSVCFFKFMISLRVKLIITCCSSKRSVNPSATFHSTLLWLSEQFRGDSDEMSVCLCVLGERPRCWQPHLSFPPAVLVDMFHLYC